MATIEAYADGIPTDFIRSCDDLSVDSWNINLIVFENDLLLVDKATKMVRYLSHDYNFDALYADSVLTVYILCIQDNELMNNNHRIMPLVVLEDEDITIIRKINDLLKGGDVNDCIEEFKFAFTLLDDKMGALCDVFCY